MARICKIGLLSLEWQWGSLALKITIFFMNNVMKKTQIHSIKTFERLLLFSAKETRTRLLRIRNSREVKYLTNSLGQKVGDKYTKLSKIAFSMKCFSTGFLRFITEKRQNFEWTAGYSPSNPRVSGIFLKYANFLRLFPSLKSFGNSWGNLCIHFLLIII